MAAPNSPRGVRPPGYEARRRKNQQRFVERKKVRCALQIPGLAPTALIMISPASQPEAAATHA